MIINKRIFRGTIVTMMLVPGTAIAAAAPTQADVKMAIEKAKAAQGGGNIVSQGGGN